MDAGHIESRSRPLVSDGISGFSYETEMSEIELMPEAVNTASSRIGIHFV